MPEKLRPVEGLLRKVGFGPKLDEFILSMNRSTDPSVQADCDKDDVAIRGDRPVSSDHG